MKFNLDCRHYIGEKPCIYNRLCDGCEYYSPFGKKILVIKLGAMGDVIRTTPVLEAIAGKFSKYHLTWVVDEKSTIFLKGNPLIHRVIPFGLETTARIMLEKFDILYCLDKEIRATTLASIALAREKFGFGFAPEGNIYPFTPDAEYSLALGMSDDLKFRKNTKTYQREIFDTLGFTNLQYGGYSIAWNNFDLDYGFKILRDKKVRPRKFVMGLNTGAGDIFATKRYLEDNVVELIAKIAENCDANILLLGGPSEIERNKNIIEKSAHIPQLIDMGCSNPMDKFAGILNCCDIIVSSDTLALHLGLALGKRMVALFGSTCAQEIDMYGLGEKIVSLPICAPCYKRECPNKENEYMICMKSLSPDLILDKIKQQIDILEKAK